MPCSIPLTCDGERLCSVNAGKKLFMFRTYFIQSPHWLLDIYDAQENPLIAGINLTPGSDNLLKGHGDILDGYQLLLVTNPMKHNSDSAHKSLTAPGSTMHLLWLEPGEDNSLLLPDPMEVIGSKGWAGEW